VIPVGFSRLSRVPLCPEIGHNILSLISKAASTETPAVIRLVPTLARYSGRGVLPLSLAAALASNAEAAAKGPAR
jgi:hypothetical protein